LKRFLKVSYLILLDDNRLPRVALPSDLSQLVLGKPFAYVTLSEVSFPFFVVSIRHRLQGQEQRRDTD
jgi:hypothetical protein